MSSPALSSFLLTVKLIGLYLFMAWPVSLPVKIDCIKQTSAKVTQKFALPLAFDDQSKNALREFWHYSYFKECLHTKGYDTHGQILPKSSFAHSLYTNPQADLTLRVNKAEILKDNQLNVDFDNRLLLSKLVLNDLPVTLVVYTRHDDLKSPADAHQITHFPDLEAPIITASPSADSVYLTDASGSSGLLFFSQQGVPRLLYGPNLNPEILAALLIRP